LFFESGKQNPDGSIQGNAADTDPLAYEPHYDLITQPDQVQIYEGIMQNSGQRGHLHPAQSGQFCQG
jgi:hypothetical protein